MADDYDKPKRWIDRVTAVLALVAGVPAAILAAYQIYLVVTHQRSILDVFGGAGGQSASPALVAACHLPGERAAWDKAVASKLRADYSAYLIAYKGCEHSEAASAALVTCHLVTNTAWKAQPASNQSVSSIAMIPNDAPDNVSACKLAQENAAKHARIDCQALVDNGGYRNAQTQVREGTCECSSVAAGLNKCEANLPYLCTWKANVAETVEECG